MEVKKKKERNEKMKVEEIHFLPSSYSTHSVPPLLHIFLVVIVEVPLRRGFLLSAAEGVRGEASD